MAKRETRYARGGWRYRPTHAWLGSPGDGAPIRPRAPVRRWRFGWRELRVLLLALLLAAVAWSQLARPAMNHNIAPATLRR